MEDTLREINMNFQMILNYVVLILILMEDTLRDSRRHCSRMSC